MTPLSSNAVRPIFIFSLPRSGSTLLQRMLAANSRVATVAEPWILLPIAGMTEPAQVRTYSDYSSKLATTAIREMIAQLPGRREQYLAAVRSCVIELYTALSKSDSTHFLDKTPRYYLIIDFIRELFPDGRFIFLFRNPLEVMASMITTWSSGRLWLHHHHIDLFQGPERLVRGFDKHSEGSFALSYRELVSSPVETCRALSEYVGIPYEDAMVADFDSVTLQGSMGDPTGRFQYKGVATTSLDRWRSVLNTPVRRWYARRYLDSLGDDTLERFGESAEDLRSELSDAPVRMGNPASDAWWLLASELGRRGAVKVLLNQWRTGAHGAPKIE